MKISKEKLYKTHRYSIEACGSQAFILDRTTSMIVVETPTNIDKNNIVNGMNELRQYLKEKRIEPIN